MYFCYSINTVQARAEFSAFKKFSVLDSTLLKSKEKYCFEITHENAYDLDSFYLALRANNILVYYDRCKSRVVVKLPEKSNMSYMTISLFSPERRISTAWSNKEVYDFKEYPGSCNEIYLYSDKSKDYSNGIQMKVN